MRALQTVHVLLNSANPPTSGTPALQYEVKSASGAALHTIWEQDRYLYSQLPTIYGNLAPPAKADRETTPPLPRPPYLERKPPSTAHLYCKQCTEEGGREAYAL